LRLELRNVTDRSGRFLVLFGPSRKDSVDLRLQAGATRLERSHDIGVEAKTDKRFRLLGFGPIRKYSSAYDE
jgi:hypothetical protein